MIGTKDNLKKILNMCNKAGFYEEYRKGKIREKINLELEIKAKLKIHKLI